MLPRSADHVTEAFLLNLLVQDVFPSSDYQNGIYIKKKKERQEKKRKKRNNGLFTSREWKAMH